MQTVVTKNEQTVLKNAIQWDMPKPQADTNNVTAKGNLLEIFFDSFKYLKKLSFFFP